MANYISSTTRLLQPLLPWLDSPMVSEILINKPHEVYIEENGALFSHEVKAYDERSLDAFFQLIANENQQEINSEKPLLSGSLLGDLRVQLVLPPTAGHYTLSIRRKVLTNTTLDAYQNRDFYQKTLASVANPLSLKDLSEEEQHLKVLYEGQNWHQFIKSAIAARKNIVISGGTSSGKTTYLNACLQEIPQAERIITLEDTREIDTLHPNQVNLLAPKGGQGQAKINMQDLVQCCLRLRPDRIIMGEIRGKEILDFIAACSTGHEGSFTTIHANNPRLAFMRMVQLYKLNPVSAMTDQEILRELQEVVDIIVQLIKTPNGRKVQSIYYKYASHRFN